MKRFRKFRDDRFALTTPQNHPSKLRGIPPAAKSDVMFSTQRLAAHANAQPILISSRPVLENAVNH
jgi:hypothetical protein